MSAVEWSMDGRFDEKLADLCSLIAEARPADVVKFAAEYFEDEQYDFVHIARTVRCLRFFHTREEIFDEKVAALYTMVTQTQDEADMKPKSFYRVLRMLGEHIPVAKIEAVQKLLQERYAECESISYKEARSCLWTLIFAQRVVWYICHLLNAEEFTDCDKNTLLASMREDSNAVVSVQDLQTHIEAMVTTLRTDEAQLSQTGLVLWTLQTKLRPQSAR